tara:strand:+ start:219 stop:467 length:249 start_codon:yes stop_codon:yes gene_type:complete
MGELVNLAAWKKRREEEKLRREAAEIEELRKKVKELMDDLGDPELGPYYLTEEEHSWMERMTKIMLTSLDGYRNWPIDSSDL